MPRGCPKKTHHKASGRAVVRLNGKDHYLGPWRSKKIVEAEYNRLIGEWLLNGKHPPATPGDGLSIAELIDRYWTFADEYYRHRVDGVRVPTGEIPPLKLALRVLNQTYGQTPAAQFNALALETVRNDMIQRGWCRRSINDHVARIKRMFNWAVEQEAKAAGGAAVEDSPLKRAYRALLLVKPLKMDRTNAVESKEVRPVPDAVVDATLPHLSAVVRAMVQVQRYTAARPGEICRMRVGDIDRNGDVWVYTPRQHKTAHHGYARTVFIGPKAQEVLRSFLLKTDPQAFVFNPAEAVAEMRQRRAVSRKTPLNHGNRPGSNRRRKPQRTPADHYDVPAYRRAIARACDLAFPVPGDIAGDAAQVKTWQSAHRWHPHQLRHTAGTQMRKHFGLEAAQVMLGHKDIQSTQRYAEVDRAKGTQVAAALG